MAQKRTGPQSHPPPPASLAAGPATASTRTGRFLPANAARHGLSREILDDRACADTIDAAYAVHEALGAWHDAATYTNALASELVSRSWTVHRSVTLSVLYKQTVVGAFPVDLLVDDRVLVIVKADARILDRTETVRGLASGARVGLAFNFAVPELFFARIL